MTFTNRVHLALPMKDKKETENFYKNCLGLTVIDYSETELCVDLFDQHIAFHTVDNFFEVKAPMVDLVTTDNQSIAVSSFHFGANIRKKDYFEMVKRIEENKIKVILGPETYTWPDGKEEYMIQFYDCNGFNLELKANSADEMYTLDDLTKWSHK